MKRHEKAILASFCSACALGAAATAPTSAPRLVVVTIATLLAVAVATPLALALARLRFEGRALAFTILILASATSPSLLAAVGPSPTGRFSGSLALGIPIATWIIYILARTLPRDLEDAAALDAAPGFRLWLSAIRPALLAAIPVVFFFCAFDLAAR